jgi:NADH-quinone oxidoreductase subunit L
MAGSLGIALGGLGLAWLVYGRRPLAAGEPDPLRGVLGPFYTLLERRYYIDEFYAATVVRFVLWLSSVCSQFDTSWVIDPFVNAVGRLTAWLATVLDVFDLRVVDGAVNGVGALASGLGRRLRQVQTGQVQDYLLVVATTVLLLVAIFAR